MALPSSWLIAHSSVCFSANRKSNAHTQSAKTKSQHQHQHQTLRPRPQPRPRPSPRPCLAYRFIVLGSFCLCLACSAAPSSSSRLCIFSWRFYRLAQPLAALVEFETFARAVDCPFASCCCFCCNQSETCNFL